MMNDINCTYIISRAMAGHYIIMCYVLSYFNDAQILAIFHWDEYINFNDFS